MVQPNVNEIETSTGIFGFGLSHNDNLDLLNIFILAYAYSLKFFPLKWRKKVKQDTLVGLAIIFFTMLAMFAWIIYFYIKLF